MLAPSNLNLRSQRININAVSNDEAERASLSFLVAPFDALPGPSF